MINSLAGVNPALAHVVQMYGRRDVKWDDPTRWVTETYPWSQQTCAEALLRLRANDVGYELATNGGGDAPLSAADKSLTNG